MEEKTFGETVDDVKKQIFIIDVGPGYMGLADMLGKTGKKVMTTRSKVGRRRVLVTRRFKAMNPFTGDLI